MERKTLLWIVIGVLFVAAVFLFFMAGNTQSTEIASKTSAGVTQAVTSSSYSGMVGGC